MQNAFVLRKAQIEYLPKQMQTEISMQIISLLTGYHNLHFKKKLEVQFIQLPDTMRAKQILFAS